MVDAKLIEQHGDWELSVDFAGDEKRGFTYVGHAVLKNKAAFRSEKFASTQVFATKAAATSDAMGNFGRIQAKTKG